MNNFKRINIYCRILLCFIFLGICCLTNAGIPDIRMLVAEYKKEFDFTMPKGGSWFSGSKHGNIKANDKCKIKGKLIKPAIKKFHVVVGSAKINEKEQLQKLMDQFSAFKPYKMQLGVQPEKGFPDNRMIYLAVGFYNSEEEAVKKQDELAETGISSWIHTEGIVFPEAIVTLNINGKDVVENKGIKLQSKTLTTLKKVEYAKGFSWHGYETRSYTGDIEVHFGFNDTIECVETIDLETVLAGVVPSEISSKAPEAALQAQAVAARGEILSKKGVKHYGCGFDSCSEQHCQVYKGNTRLLETMKKSIKPTQGFVLMNHNDGTILDAVYSANCGGHSSTNDKIWVSNYNPHLQGVADTVGNIAIKDLRNEKMLADYIKNPPECWCSRKEAEGSAKFRWTKNIDTQEWAKIEELAGIGRIYSVEILEREVSGRIVAIKLNGSEGSKTVLKELPIRKLLGAGTVLRSSCFIADFKSDTKGYIVGASLLGAGWGHGVGMCQTGAQARAMAGQTFKKILTHYFPGANLLKLY